MLKVTENLEPKWQQPLIKVRHAVFSTVVPGWALGALPETPCNTCHRNLTGDQGPQASLSQNCAHLKPPVLAESQFINHSESEDSKGKRGQGEALLFGCPSSVNGSLGPRHSGGTPNGSTDPPKTNTILENLTNS